MQMERRDFLRIAGAAIASSTAAGGVGASANVASGKIRAAIYGTQHSHTIGKLNAMQTSPHYDVVGYFEPDPAARETRKKDPRYKNLRMLSEDELLGDRSIDLVVVECAVWEALPWGSKVIAAGKHLHLEKPPGNDMAAFRELVEEARRKRLLLQTGYMWRFHDGIIAAMEAARQGWLGDAYMVRGTINTDLGAAGRQTVGRYRGGQMFELGGHLIDRIVAFWGRPREVRSWLRHDTSFPDKTADNNLTVLEYDKGLAVVTSAARMAGASQHRSFEIIGTDGTFQIQPVEPGNKMRVSMREAKGPYKAGWQEVEMPNQPRYIGDFKELARALLGKEPLKYSYDHELLVHETLLRASGEAV
jgi:predicted dehydrogenase